LSRLDAVVQQANVGRSSDSNQIAVRATRDGSIFTAPWLTALALEGRLYAVNYGEGSTPVAVNAAFAAAEPDLYTYVPDATAIIPVFLQISIQDTLAAGAVQDIAAVASSTSDATVTGTAQTIHNVRTDAPSSSNCTVSGTVTGAGTSPYTGNYYEFWRPESMAQGDSATVGAGIGPYTWDWSVNTSGVTPIIIGAGSLSIFCSNAAGAQTGFFVQIWAELPESAVNG